jgi:RNA-directed DNA polymerase
LTKAPEGAVRKIVGGVISPLLANIALHGLEKTIRAAFPEYQQVDGVRTSWQPTVVRYADDFVICHSDPEVIQRCKAVAQDWLKDMGLELKPSKTRVAHTLLQQGGCAGFDFLGFQVRQYPVGKHRTGKNTAGRPLGFKTIIKPSKDKVKLHQKRLAELVKHLRGAPQEALIHNLNPVIRGWCNYYRTVVSKVTFRKADDVLYHALRSWAFWRHPHEGKRRVVRKYWHLPTWSFGVVGGPTLLRHSGTRIVRHVKVRGNKSPYDGDWAYWASRLGRYPGIRIGLAMLLKRQKGQCVRCGLYFKPDDLVEVHHRDGEHSNNKWGNLAALHRHCHDAEHGPGTVKPKESVHDKDWLFEEPYEDERLMYGSEDQHGGRPPC